MTAVPEPPLPGLAQEVGRSPSPGRPFRELSEAGLLWLINAAVFHPRGYALALAMDIQTGEVTGWDILGDGTEPWQYAEGMNERFAAAEATLASYRRRVVGYRDADGWVHAPEDVEILLAGDSL